MKLSSNEKIGHAFRSLVVSNAFTVLVQIISIPLLLSGWGVATYGEWVILYTVPSLIAMSDLGVVTVSNNVVEKLVINKRFSSATSYSFTSECVVYFYIILFFSIFAAFALIFSSNLSLIFQNLNEGAWIWIGVLLFFDSALNLIFNQRASILRSIDRYHVALNWQALARLLSLSTPPAVTLLGQGPLVAAISMVVLKLLLYSSLLKYISSRIHWINRKFQRFSLKRAKEIMALSGTFVLLPLSNILYLHFTTIIIGFSFGAETVAVFTTLRTISRALPQFVGLIGRSVWSEVTRAHGLNDVPTVSSLYRRTCLYTAVAMTVGASVMGLLGPTFITWWTHGAFKLDLVLFYLLVLQSSAISFYTSTEVFLLSTNSHSSYAFIFIISSALQLIISWLALPIFGISSFAFVGFVGSVINAIVVFYEVRRRKLIAG